MRILIQGVAVDSVSPVFFTPAGWTGPAGPPLKRLCWTDWICFSIAGHETQNLR